MRSSRLYDVFVGLCIFPLVFGFAGALCIGASTLAISELNSGVELEYPVILYIAAAFLLWTVVGAIVGFAVKIAAST